MKRQIILDTETTGFRPEEGHRIIEIGAIELIDRRFTKNNRHFYLNPERDIDEGALRVHGLSRQFLSDKLLFAAIAHDFFEFIQGAELVIHNAPFDLNFLEHEFRWLNQNHPPIQSVCSVLDTLLMARKRHVGQKNSLDALCKRYDVNCANRQLHGALLDAQLLADVYLRMTGGQNSLFDLAPELPKTAATLDDNLPGSQHNNRALHVIYADPQEQALHQQYMENMRKKEGCLWKQ